MLRSEYFNIQMCRSLREIDMDDESQAGDEHTVIMQ